MWQSPDKIFTCSINCSPSQLLLFQLSCKICPCTQRFLNLSISTFVSGLFMAGFVFYFFHRNPRNPLLHAQPLPYELLHTHERPLIPAGNTFPYSHGTCWMTDAHNSQPVTIPNQPAEWVRCICHGVIQDCAHPPQYLNGSLIILLAWQMQRFLV